MLCVSRSVVAPAVRPPVRCIEAKARGLTFLNQIRTGQQDHHPDHEMKKGSSGDCPSTRDQDTVRGDRRRRQMIGQRREPHGGSASRNRCACMRVREIFARRSTQLSGCLCHIHPSHIYLGTMLRSDVWKSRNQLRVTSSACGELLKYSDWLRRTQ